MDDLSLAWSSAPSVFNGQPFLLRWSAAYKRHDSPQAAIWMCLPGLPLPLYNPSLLKAIEDSLGRFLRSDDMTSKFKNPRAARLCVEMDLSAPPPPAFVVAIGDLKVQQRIIYESRLLFCTRCSLQGHCTISCRNRKRKLPAPSGKECGALLPTGTFGHPNQAPPLPHSASHKHPPGACQNSLTTSLLSNQPPLGACSGPTSPSLGPAQAQFPSNPLVLPDGPAPLALPTSPLALSLPLTHAAMVSLG
ncbi:DUF4283 domain-containing protein [Cephalotus follicularis]|uniref:DUF4283 domain-containing protein n=1 Tax=Cephalotus follicularis TaxID=3775 RepID=A0A1Q3CEH6_CEPFO|nr:DUF4283 domain-containing protein [Cephalotus follicularis]